MLVACLALETKHLEASKQQQIDKSIYLYGSVNGKSGWVSKAYLVDTAKPTPAPTPKPSTPTTNNKLTVSALNGVAQINAKKQWFIHYSL